MNVKPLKKSTNDRSDATRARLIDAGMNLFGINGYEATTTRALADAAGTNLASIPYHFGGKDGLYRAVAEAIVEGMDNEMGEFISKAERDMEGGIASSHQATALVESIMESFAEVMLVKPEAESWMCFMMREQMEPTEAFAIVYNSPVKRMRTLFAKLIAHISGQDHNDPRVRLIAIQLLGLVYVYRVARASTLREMGLSAINEQTFPEIRKVILEGTRALLRGLQQKAA